MGSLIFNSCLNDVFRGMIDFASDDFRVMLAGSGYSPDKAHTKRSQVTDEVIGNGYKRGGSVAPVTLAKDPSGDRIDVSLGGSTWANSTIKARFAVYYKSRGAPAEDSLIAAIDFGDDVTSINGEFSLTPSTIRIQN